MADVTVSSQPGATDTLPRLETGDHLDQATFHQRYEAMPPKFRAELIGGFVVVPSPLSQQHGRYHAEVMLWLGQYQAHTSGAAAYDNATLILGPDSEPQPDAVLIVDPDFGGQTRRNENDYLAGPPELIVEVASSSEAYDLHEKLRDYERAGVGEYVVVLIRDQQIRWFYLQDGRYAELPVGDDSVYRSRVFPGLHLDTRALLALDSLQVLETLNQGLASPEHTAFVRELQAQRSGL